MEILAWWIYGSLILLTLLLAGGVVRVFLPPRLPKVREAACANCRYPVQGLGDWKCPECGTDLRVGGILTPRLRHRARARLAGGIVCWSLLMGVAGLFTAQVTVWRMVREVRHQAHVEEVIVGFWSKSRQYRDIEFVRVVKDPADGSDPIETSGLLVNGQHEVEIDPHSLTEDEVLHWLQSVGVDTSFEQIRMEVRELTQLVRSEPIKASMNGWATQLSTTAFHGTTVKSQSRAMGPVWYSYDINPWLYAIGGGWLAVFIGGLWFMVWWRGRQRVTAG